MDTQNGLILFLATRQPLTRDKASRIAEVFRGSAAVGGFVVSVSLGEALVTGGALPFGLPLGHLGALAGAVSDLQPDAPPIRHPNGAHLAAPSGGWRAQFPDFPESDMPDLSALAADGWEDSSWRNEPCPSFTCDVFTIWTDYAADDRREHPGGARFAITERVAAEEMHTHLETDAWADIPAFVNDGRRDFPEYRPPVNVDALAESALNLQQAAAAIVRARDYCAEHGRYNPLDFGPADDQGFDDWAADILQTAIGKA